MSGQWQPAQYLLNPDREIFRGWNDGAEILKLIQILMIEAVEHFAGDHRVQRGQIADHSGFRRDGAADRDLKKIIVAVSVGMVALAIGFPVGLRR